MVTGANWKRPWEETGGDLKSTALASGYGNAENSTSLLQQPERSTGSLPASDAESLRTLTSSINGSHCAQRPVHWYGNPDFDTTVNTHQSKRRRIHHNQCDQLSGPTGPWSTTEADRSSSSYLGDMESRPYTPPRHSQTLLLESSRRASEEAGRGSQGNCDPQTPTHQTACSGCRQIRHIVQDIVSGLAELVTDLRCDPTVKSGTLPSCQIPNVAHTGIPLCLEWVRGTLRNTSNAVRNRTADRAEVPASGTIEGNQLHRALWSRSDDPPTQESCFGLVRKENDNVIRRNWSGSLDERSRMTSHPVSEGRRSSVAGELPLAFEIPESAESVTGTVILPSPKSVSRPASGLLPTPSTTRFPSGSSTLPPISPPLQASPSAQAAHFQDLQHQVSTKSLALQTLQREHDHLLSVYSRSKTRCATLEKKFQVSDVEINKLIEERLSLQSQVEALQAQVECLTKARDDARSQSVANGGQYMKIMSMASRLEAQSAADKKKWTAEREEWDRTREEQERRFAQLEKEKEAALRMVNIDRSPLLETEMPKFCTHFKSVSPVSASNVGEGRRKSSSIASANQAGDTSACPANEPSQDNIICSDSLEVLRAEIVRLRKGCHAMDVALHDLKNDGYRIEQVMQKFGNIGKMVVTKADAASQYLRRPKSTGEDLAVAAPEGSRGEGCVKTNEER